MTYKCWWCDQEIPIKKVVVPLTQEMIKSSTVAPKEES